MLMSTCTQQTEGSQVARTEAASFEALRQEQCQGCLCSFVSATVDSRFSLSSHITLSLSFSPCSDPSLTAFDSRPMCDGTILQLIADAVTGHRLLWPSPDKTSSARGREQRGVSAAHRR